MVKVLTKDNCQYCNNLKMFLRMGLGGSLDDKIEFVHKETNEQEYEKLKEVHNVQSVPFAVADNGDTLSMSPFDPVKAEQFISSH